MYIYIILCIIMFFTDYFCTGFTMLSAFDSNIFTLVLVFSMNSLELHRIFQLLFIWFFHFAKFSLGLQLLLIIFILFLTLFHRYSCWGVPFWDCSQTYYIAFFHLHIEFCYILHLFSVHFYCFSLSSQPISQQCQLIFSLILLF